MNFIIYLSQKLYSNFYSYLNLKKNSQKFTIFMQYIFKIRWFFYSYLLFNVKSSKRTKDNSSNFSYGKNDKNLLHFFSILSYRNFIFNAQSFLTIISNKSPFLLFFFFFPLLSSKQPDMEEFLFYRNLLTIRDSCSREVSPAYFCSLFLLSELTNFVLSFFLRYHWYWPSTSYARTSHKMTPFAVFYFCISQFWQALVLHPKPWPESLVIRPIHRYWLAWLVICCFLDIYINLILTWSACIFL